MGTSCIHTLSSDLQGNSDLRAPAEIRPCPSVLLQDAAHKEKDLQTPLTLHLAAQVKTGVCYEQRVGAAWPCRWGAVGSCCRINSSEG
jgi:hypothetical protein